MEFTPPTSKTLKKDKRASLVSVNFYQTEMFIRNVNEVDSNLSNHYFVSVCVCFYIVSFCTYKLWNLSAPDTSFTRLETAKDTTRVFFCFPWQLEVCLTFKHSLCFNQTSIFMVIFTGFTRDFTSFIWSGNKKLK